MKNLRKLDVLIAMTGCMALLVPFLTLGGVYAVLMSCLLLTLLVEPLEL